MPCSVGAIRRSSSRAGGDGEQVALDRVNVRSQVTVLQER